MAISGWIPDLMKERQRYSVAQLRLDCPRYTAAVCPQHSSQQSAARSTQHTAADPQLSSLWKNRKTVYLGLHFSFSTAMYTYTAHVHPN